MAPRGGRGRAGAAATDAELAVRAADTMRRLDWRVCDVLAQKKDTLRDWTEAILYSDLALLRRHRVSTGKVARFVHAVSEGYRDENPFHNFAHAFGVAHTAWTMLQTPTAMDLLDSTERLAVLLASLCHDLGHPGNTNAYEVNTLSPLALTYNDEAVLERHHCFLAFQLLYRDERCNILGGLKPHSEEMQTIRRTLVHLSLIHI